MTFVFNSSSVRAGFLAIVIIIAASLALLLPASGCSSNNDQPSAAARELHLPSDAQPVVAGMGNSELAFKAQEDGRVWVMDKTANQVLTRHRLRAGQQFMLSPSQDAATVDGRPVTDIQHMKLDPGHQYYLYFERE